MTTIIGGMMFLKTFLMKMGEEKVLFVHETIHNTVAKYS